MDTTLIHADIFFFITTIAVVVVAFALTLALIYLALVLNGVRKIVREVRDEAVLFREDIDGLRQGVKREGFRIRHLFDFWSKFVKRQKNSRSKK